MDLPAELQNIIAQHAVGEAANLIPAHITVDGTGGLAEDCKATILPHIRAISQEPGLCRVNRQLRAETLQIFHHRRITVDFTTASASATHAAVVYATEHAGAWIAQRVRSLDFKISHAATVAVVTFDIPSATFTRVAIAENTPRPDRPSATTLSPVEATRILRRRGFGPDSPLDGAHHICAASAMMFKAHCHVVQDWECLTESSTHIKFFSPAESGD